MRFSPHLSFQCLAAAASDATMSSPRFPPRGRNPWRRGFSDRPSGVGGIGGRGEAAFVSGDSHFRTVRDSNYGFRQGGNYGIPGWFPRQPFRPRPPFGPQTPRQRPDDFRSWENTLSQPPPNCERFVVLSYNILADYLAREHRPQLYFHIPPYILDWEWRKRRILTELRLWSPDIICLQEVDRFEDLEEELKLQGYHGIWKMRTGPPVDGCAIFWRTARFTLLHEEYIEFDKLGLRNNVAQICILESRSPRSTENDSAAAPSSSHPSRRANQVVVCNTHVLYNPNRGDIKIGQVRMLLDRAYAVSRTWNGAPVVVCGDFNCTPKSPLYNFISEQKLNLSGLAKNQVSGQFSASIYSPWPDGANPRNGLFRDQSPSDNSIRPFASVVDANTVKQGIYFVDAHNQHMLHNGLDASLTENLSLPQRMIGSREISSKPSVNACYTKENNTMSNAGKEGLESILDGSSIECMSSQHGLVHVLEETSKECDEQPGSYNNPPVLRTSNPAIATSQDSVYGDREKERLHFKLTSEENISSEGNTAEGKSDPAIPCQSAQAMVDFSANKVDQSIQEDEGSCQDMGTTNASEETPSYGRDISSFDIDYKNGRPCSDEVKYLSNECASTSEIHGDQSHFEASEVSPEPYSFGIDQGAGISHVSCREAETSVTSFAKDMPGKEKICVKADDKVINSSFSEQTLHSSHLDVHQPQSLSSLECDIVGKLEEINFEKPDATIADDSKLDCVSPEILDDSSLSMDVEVNNEVEKKPYDPYLWTPSEVATASGNAECTLAEHHLKLRSTYTEVEDYAGTKDSSREPQVTSYNRRFMGTVDYIWCSEGLQTVSVLDTIPKHVLQRTPGFPTRKWGSDHLAIACQLSFTKVTENP